MKKLKFAVAARSRVAGENAARFLSEDEEVASASAFPSADALLDGFEGFLPDAVLISDDLGEEEVKRLVCAVKKASSDCRVMIFISSRGAEAVKVAAGTEADAVAALPFCREELRAAAFGLFSDEKREPVGYDEVAKILMRLGISPASAAFPFLVRAVTAASESAVKKPLCELYKNAADSLEGVPASAEASARRAIKSACGARPEEFEKLGFGSRPELGSFIYRIVREARKK